MLGIIFAIVIAVCGFSFPAFLIEAIREDDVETAKTAKIFACITFGVLVLCMGFLIVLSS